MEQQLTKTQTDNTLAIIQAAPDALMLNKMTIEKAVAAVEAILLRIEKEGMSDEHDVTLNKALVRLKERYAECKDRRTPATKLFDEIRSEFTSLEALIDPAKKGNVYDRAQSKRNDWTQHKIKLQREDEEAQRIKLAGEQERIALKAEAEIQLRNGFLTDMANAVKILRDIFDGATLETFAEVSEKVFNFSEIYTIAEFNAIPISIRGVYNDQVAIENIILNVHIGKYDEWVIEYKNAMRNNKLNYTDKLSGKKKELEAMEAQRVAKIEADKKAADAKNAADRQAALDAAKKAIEEQERLNKEKEDREERDRIAADKAEADAKLKSAQDAEATKQVEMTQSLFDNAVETAAVVEDIKAIEGYEIEVTNSAGWLLIAQFWFTNEGMKCSNEEIEKKTFKQMKAFCEKWYKKNGATGLTSPYIKYNEVFKAKTGLK